MSPVRRRAPRPGKRWLIPAILLGLLAALVVAWLLLREKPVVLPDPVVAHPVALSDRPETELARIEIAPPGETPYAIEKTAEGWRMADDADFPFRPAALDAIVRYAALVYAEDTVGDMAEHPEWQTAHFGLADTAARVTVRFTDGGSLAFRIGDDVPQEIPACYLLLEGDSHIYTAGTDVREAFTYSRLGLHDVQDPALKADLIDRVAFSGENAFAMERRADGWYLTAPFVYPLSDAAVNSLLGKLEGLRFAEYVSDEADADLTACGLQPPRRTLTLDIAESVVTGYDANDQSLAETRLPAYQLTFGLGDSENDVIFYCLYRGEVVKATVFSAGFLLTQGYDALLLTAPFNAPTNDLSRLTVARDGEKTVYALSLQERVLPNNDFETDENGNILHDVAVTKNGLPIDGDAFLTVYRQLIELRTLDRLPDGWTPPDGAPLLSVTLERSASSRTVSLYSLDALHDAVAVDGVALYRVEKGWVDLAWP